MAEKTMRETLEELNRKVCADPAPPPWSDPGRYGRDQFELTGNGRSVAIFNNLEDARLARRAVNNHAFLVAALEGLIDHARPDNWSDEDDPEQAAAWRLASRALARVKGLPDPFPATVDSSAERCPVCDWPLAESADKGCVPGDCSYRPDFGTAEYDRIRARRAAIARAALGE